MFWWLKLIIATIVVASTCGGLAGFFVWTMEKTNPYKDPRKK